MPNHHLILILGKGQTVLNPEFKKEYRKAIYSTDQFKTGYITPFVGDAIINQPNLKYTHVHILGTKTSMWDTLFYEIAGENFTEDILGKAEVLAAVIKEETTSPEDLEEVSKLYGEMHGLKAFSYIIPVSENDDDSMAIFNKIIELKDIKDGDTISIDITHGLRYQPLFLLTGFEYFSKLKKVKMGDIFYGALELSNFNVNMANKPRKQGKIDLSQIQKNPRGSGSHNKDEFSLAEIQNFKIINKMFEAINAGNLFVKYGKTDLLLQLEPLKKREKLSRLLQEFDYRIQLASLDKIRERSLELLETILEELRNVTSPIDRLLLEAISQLPRKIAKRENELLASLYLCNFYVKSEMYNNAALAVWDVMLNYVAVTYKIEETKETSEFLKDFITIKLKSIPEFKDTVKIMSNLRAIRNSLAHTFKAKGSLHKSVETIKEANIIVQDIILNDRLKTIPQRIRFKKV